MVSGLIFFLTSYKPMLDQVCEKKITITIIIIIIIIIIISFCYLPSPVQSDFANAVAEGAVKSVRINRGVRIKRITLSK